jgi:formylglycine-generating enzyme required for sulfatase activity
MDGVDPSMTLLVAAFDRFEATLDLIRSAGWGIKITPPVEILSPSVRPAAQEVRDSTHWVLRVATGKRVAIAAALAVLSIIVLIAWRQTPRESGDRRTPLANQTQVTAVTGPSIPSPVPDLNTVPAGGEAEVKAQPEDAGPPPGTVRMNPKDGLAYVWIPPGSFQMGCSPGDTECLDNEKPPHQVTISKGFWLGQSEVTVYAYKRFSEATGRQMPPEPVFGGRRLNLGWGYDAMPMANLIWDDAQAYCGWAGGRLPTEAEWEYAARAGSTASRYGDLDEISWNADNSGLQRIDSFGMWNENHDNYPKRLAENGNGMHEIGQKKANDFGLYDMLGNVWEWLNDWYSEKYYQESPSQDPVGPASERLRTLRGGSWDSPPWIVRASFRGWFQPGLRRPSFGVRCGGEVFAP